MTTSNGHELPTVQNHPHLSPSPSRSESELSEIHDNQVINRLSPDPQDDDQSMEDAVHDMQTSESDDDEDADGEEDADYDAEPPMAIQDSGRHGSMSSQSSSHHSKRKHDDYDEDECMAQNPELYGLRRSVSLSMRRLAASC